MVLHLRRGEAGKLAREASFCETRAWRERRAYHGTSHPDDSPQGLALLRDLKGQLSAQCSSTAKSCREQDGAKHRSLLD